MALPPLPDPGPDDGTASHSPDTFVQAEKLLVRQALTLEDGDHPVMDAAAGGGGGEEGCRPEALSPSPPSLSYGAPPAPLEAGQWPLAEKTGLEHTGRLPPWDAMCPRASDPISSSRPVTGHLSWSSWALLHTPPPFPYP